MNLIREGSLMSANTVDIEKGKSLVVYDAYSIKPENLESEIDDSPFSKNTVIGIAEILHCYENSNNVYMQQSYVQESVIHLLTLLKKEMRELHRLVSLSEINKRLYTELLMSCDINDSSNVYAMSSHASSNYAVWYKEMEMLIREIAFFEDLKKFLLKRDYKQVFRCLYIYEDLI